MGGVQWEGAPARRVRAWVDFRGLCRRASCPGLHGGRAGACLTCALGSFLPEITLGSVGGPQAVCWCIDTGYSFILWPLFGPFCCPGRGISLLLMGYVAPQLCPILSTTGGLCSAGTGAWMVSGNTHMEWELVKYAFHFVVSLQVFWNMPASS